MMKVVIVEDEALVRRGIVLAVDWTAVDCIVVGEAADGTEGLEVIRRYQPDLVITDVNMPKMDGIEMLRQLRAEGNRAQVVLLTAYSDFNYAQAALKLGAADYLLKPFQDGELEAVVRRLQKKGEAPAAPELPTGGEKSKYVMEAIRTIAQSYNAPDLSVSSLAQSLGVSEGHLSHVFKKETSYTVSNYITNYRIRMAMELLRDCRSRVYDVAEQVGYRDITYFSSTFKKITGMTPTEYQKQSQ
jgi:two-component system response regulator YesN